MDLKAMDHRSKIAEKKRLMMRTKLIDAATRVFADRTGPVPVIDDVIREAKVSRGTFYNYFDSLEQVVAAIGQEFSNQMITDILPVYDVLTQPWQRASVGFRVFLVRALLDRKWAGFMALPDAWPHHTLLARYMGNDLENGKRAGQFHFDDVSAASDFLMGATSLAIQSIRQGLTDPNAYMNAYTRMALASLGCTPRLCDEGVVFSLSYLQDWASGRLDISKPLWALNMNSKDGQLFLGYAVA
ncbi:TetR/AcrR family transcriptional regulator [Burkholderia sp. Ax-1719]|jgi:AcrR family transcriptional regulator|uniref:TetR/AcrR family transcriptional regulator n=1 Tax=Burkholderia sp. Ax-1719 TaxID=2608334 RepID=UPI001422DDF0|nr:TetR/AcrR family transcriptional regulator [Burkholderia sp. Ax-1719]NIE66050.1 TetR/AcrR family transcriptional regulator [Burkholderia sp. Ax-1719]